MACNPIYKTIDIHVQSKIKQKAYSCLNIDKMKKKMKNVYRQKGEKKITYYDKNKYFQTQRAVHNIWFTFYKKKLIRTS